MILVTLGTQDKQFTRILRSIDNQIVKGNIKDKVIVQAGFTKYHSKNMIIRDFMDMKELEKLQKQADLIITHGGVGSIIGPLKYHKKIIAVPRLKEFGEHTNDHQLQIINNFENAGYIIALKNLNNIDKALKQARNFEPKTYTPNDKILKETVRDYIGKNKRNYLFLSITLFIFLFVILLILRFF